MTVLEKLEDFDEIIKSGKTVVDFYATWCGPCNMMSPVIEEVAKENESIKFLKVDVDNYPELAKRFGVMSIPTIKVFNDGEEINSNVGFMPKSELEDFIK